MMAITNPIQMIKLISPMIRKFVRSEMMLVSKGTVYVAIIIPTSCPVSIRPMIRLDCPRSKSLIKTPQKPSTIIEVMGISITKSAYFSCRISPPTVNKILAAAMNIKTETKLMMINVLNRSLFCSSAYIAVDTTPSMPDIKYASLKF